MKESLISTRLQKLILVSDQIVGLDGVGEGTLTVKGPLKNLDFNGEIYLDSTYLVSVPYGIRMRFADDPVQIHIQ